MPYYDVPDLIPEKIVNCFFRPEPTPANTVAQFWRGGRLQPCSPATGGGP
jgi:hypothetical protein